LIRGDALLRIFRYFRAGRAHGDQYQFRLALVDLEPLQRAREYLQKFEVTTREFLFAEAFGTHRRMVGIRTNARPHFERITELCSWPVDAAPSWRLGFLAGIFDAEGSYSRGILRISNTDSQILDEAMRCLVAFGFRSEEHTSELQSRGQLVC